MTIYIHVIVYIAKSQNYRLVLELFSTLIAVTRSFHKRISASQVSGSLTESKRTGHLASEDAINDKQGVPGT